MGVKLFDLITPVEIDFKDLSNKVIIIDGNLNLYQFLSSIRQRDGSLLTDSNGNTTSHLIGIFNRTARLLQYGIKPCYVFDGKPPELKNKERQRRREVKEEAARKYKQAETIGNVQDMKKYAARTSRLTPLMVEESKQLMSALGIPVVQAPSEGEAQAAHIVKEGHAYGVGSQDADSFMFGTPRLLKNLTISSRKKLPGRIGYVSVKPELIELDKVLKSLEINHEQLIILGILIGTDYNLGGIKGIGPKNALKLIKQRKDYDKLFKELNWDFDFPWQKVYDTITKMPVTDNYNLNLAQVDGDKVMRILCDQHDFSTNRVRSTLDKITTTTRQQSNLGDFF